MFGIWPAGLAQNPGPRWLRLLVYVVKALDWARPGPTIFGAVAASCLPYFLVEIWPFIQTKNISNSITFTPGSPRAILTQKLRHVILVINLLKDKN
jgi:hypothetical protein